MNFKASNFGDSLGKNINVAIIEDQKRRGTFREDKSRNELQKLELKPDLSNIKENPNEFEGQEEKPKNNRKENDSLDRDSSLPKKRKDNTTRAYEYFRSSTERKEDLNLLQKDQNYKLKDKQSQLAQQLSIMQQKLKSVGEDLKYHGNDGTLNQDDFHRVIKENNQLKKELQAVQLAKSVVVAKNKDKRLVKTIPNQESLASRDKKKVSDLLKLVDKLKGQVRDNEDQMKRQQFKYNPSGITPGGQSMTSGGGGGAGQISNLREQSAKVLGLEAKNNELHGNLTEFKNQLKAFKAENTQLLTELKESKEQISRLSRENRSLELSLQNAEDYQKQIVEIRRQRDQTEARLKELLTSPFFKDHGESSKRAVRLHELEEDIVRFQVFNEQLSAKTKLQERELENLNDIVNDSKKIIEDLKEDNESLKVELESQAKKFGPLQQLQSLDHGTYLKTLGTLTMSSHKNRMKGMNSILDEDNEDNVQVEETDEDARENLIHKQELEIEQLKVDKGEIAVHLEKIQAMLRIQIETNLQRDKIYNVEKEAADLRYKALLDKAQELADITDMKGFLTGEHTASAKDQTTEGQLFRKGNVDYSDNVSEFSDDEETAIDESKGQNFFDLWVGNCTVYPMNLSKATSGQITEQDNILIFSTFDFYDHETQTTPVAEGLKSFFNFQCSYKISTKDAFLHYLETGNIKIELYAASHQEAILLGVAELSLSYLFKKNKRDKVSAVLNERVPILNKGFSVGEIDIKARLRKPISNQIKFYLEKKNLELEQIEDYTLKQKRIDEANKSFDEFEKIHDESVKRKLVIAIDKGQGFLTKSSTFIYYSIQGKDYYTKSVSGNNPHFDHHQIVEITNLASFSSSIQKIPIQFFVFDDQSPVSGDGANDSDCLGIAHVKIDGLNKNHIIDSIANVENDRKQKIGTLYIKAFWYEYQDSIEEVSKFGEGILAKQWEKEFALKLAKAIKARYLNTNNAFLIFDRNNDQIIDRDEFISSCLGTFNLSGFSRDEVIFFYEKQRQPFNRDVFESIVRQFLVEDKQRLQYFEEMNVIERNQRQKEGDVIRKAEKMNFDEMQRQQIQKLTNNNQEEGSPASLRQVNSLLQKNTNVLLDKSRQEALREMISEAIFSEMKRTSALDVFMLIDSDKDDEVTTKELQRYFISVGINAKPDEILQFLTQVDTNKNGTIDLIEFMNYISKEKLTRTQYQQRYPKLNSSQTNQQITSNGTIENFSDEQIITQIEEKIFEYMISKKIKILKLHEQMDKDKNSSVGRPEFKAFFKNKIGVELTRRDLDVVFSRFDRDNDGSISVKEFVDHLKAAINMRQSLKDLRSSQASISASATSFSRIPKRN